MHLKIDNTWSLFLDRDGVINERLPDDYIKSWEQFRFIEGTLEAMKTFAKIFGRIVVVSNQQGVGKGLMDAAELEKIHNLMQQKVLDAGGRLDKIYYSPYLASENHVSRKPSIGMALMARHDFREISFRKSIMAGDSFGDILFGKRLGMKTVFIGDRAMARKYPHLTDYVYPDLITFAKSIEVS